MKKEDLKKLSNEELQKKIKNTKTLMGIFIPVILGLLYYGLRDYFNGSDIDTPTSIIAICSIGGFVSLFPELKKLRAEQKSRKERKNRH